MKRFIKHWAKYLISVVKSDFKSLRFEYLLWQEQKLVRKAHKIAYKAHMITNKRYYIHRVRKNEVEIYQRLQQNGFVVAVISNKHSGCVIFINKQADLLIHRFGLIPEIVWKRRAENGIFFVVDTYFNKRTAIDFSNMKR